MSEINKYSMKIVSAITGLSAHLIRAWEKRYNAITPARSLGERRLFSDADVERLKLLKNAVSSGYRIGDIADRTNEDLLSLTKSIIPDSTDSSEIHSFLGKVLTAIETYNPEDLENILFEASLKLNQNELIYQLVIPLITEIGERWYNRKFSIAQEHLSISVVISFLHYLKGIYKVHNNAPLLLTCSPKGQFHELGALMVSIISASHGWKVIHLGTNLPAYEIAATADFSKAKMICLSIVYPYDDPELKKELLYLKNAKSNHVIIAGGSAASSYQKELEEAGIILMRDLQGFVKYLKHSV